MIIELQIAGNERRHYLSFIDGKWIEFDDDKYFQIREFDHIGLAISCVWSYLQEMYDSDLKIEFHRKHNCNMVDERF